MQPISNQDTYWKDKLPVDYEDMIKWSKYDLQCETTEDLYNTFCRGFSLNDGEQWFSIDRDGKKCVTVSAREALEEDKWKWTYLAESRFEEVADYFNLPKFGILCKFRSKLLSPQTTYGVYLVYKLSEGYRHVNPPPVLVADKGSHPKEVHNIFLRTPQTPVISYTAKNKALNPSNMPKMEDLPKERSDGWMEVQVHKFQTRPNIKMVSARLSLSSYDMGFQGLTVQCLEFRPV
ncbi:putative F-box protein PP2-B2 [Bidens hawaiensis]|uniref:putative F-box protein PP2-B2 n=1 Tax=Bidens hawaiensis TaxID=980011 RepID=UPI00404AF937